MATEIASLYAKIGADSSSFDRAIGGVEGRLHSVGSLVKGAFAVGVGAAVAGVTALGATIAKATSNAAAMEQNIADISATMGLTADQTAKLGKLITDLGVDPKLKVSATEAAEAIGMLGQAGLSYEQISGGAARATILLANATGADMATAASVATDAMALWKMDAANMTGAINGITGATIQSKFSINDYALALSQGGGVAAGLGVSFEDFNAVISATASSFASGSDAGTSFKTFLQRLLPQTAEAGDLMRSLGLYTGKTRAEMTKTADKISKLKEKIAALDPKSKTYAETLAKLTAQQKALEDSMVNGQSAFYDTEGNMKSITEVADIMQKTFSGMTGQQQNDVFSTLFGSDAMRTALGLMNTGAEGIEKMKAAIGGTSAEDSAAKRMNTLSGSIEILTGNLEAMSIMVGEKFLPPLKQAVDGITNWISQNKDAILNFFNPIAEGFQHLINILTQSEQPFKDVLRLFGVWAGELWNFVAPELAKFWGNFLGWILSPDTHAQIWNNMVGAWNWFVEWGKTLYGQLAPQLISFWTGLISWVTDPAKRAVLLGAIENNWVAFGAWAKGLWNTISTMPEFISLPGRINAWIAMNVPQLQPWIDGFAQFGAGLTTEWQKQYPELLGIFEEFVAGMEKKLDRLQKAFENIFGVGGKGGQLQEYGKNFVAVFSWIEKYSFGIIDSIGEQFVGLAETIGYVVQAFNAAKNGDWGKFGSLMGSATQSIIKSVSAPFTAPMNVTWDAMQEFNKWLSSQGRASGGPVGAGNAYLVGEKGPEMFVPGSSGSIVPNGSGGRFDIYLHGDTPASRELALEVARIMQREVYLRGATLAIP